MNMWPISKKKTAAEELAIPDPEASANFDIAKLRKRIAEADHYAEQADTLPEKAYSYNAVKNAGVTNRIKDRFWPEKSYLINMELRNGMHKTFMISTKHNYFKFMEGIYIIDQQCQYFNVSSRTYCLDYHQDLPLPIRREIPVKEIMKTMRELSKIDPDQLVTAMNPLSLDAFIEGRVIEGLMKAQGIDAFFKNMRLIFIIILCECTAHLLLFMKAAGMFSNLKIPGIG